MPVFGMSDCLPSEMDALFDTFDQDGSGFISFRELHRMLRPNMLDEAFGGRRHVSQQPFDISMLRKQMKLDVLKLGARQALRSAIRPEEEWARLGFPTREGDEEEEDETPPVSRPRTSEGNAPAGAAPMIPSMFSAKSTLLIGDIKPGSKLGKMQAIAKLAAMAPAKKVASPSTSRRPSRERME